MPTSVAKPSSRLAAPLRALVRAALASQGRRAGEIGIVLTDDAAVRALNRRWRGIDRATDVLSFGYDDGAPADGASALLRAGRAAPPPVNGDLVISLDRMRAQAKRYRVSDARELARLVVHGALHLAGLDHHRATERARMRAVEARVLRGARATIAALERGLARGAR
ncbi:MAG TPA: rRNA maturation RNase YbeY [Candidatus Eisenbacteria bacterium]|nr:rRNA maturation RNase YbeY [Candidatus Eisenbacteria bacterium]